MSSSTSIEINYLSVTGDQKFSGPFDLSDIDGRPIIAALVNSIKELLVRIDQLETRYVS